jgi:uncharacterized DUF497 family protein
LGQSQRKTSRASPHRCSDAEDVLSGNHVLFAYEAEGGEERWTAVGMTRNGRMLVIVFAIRDELVRPITGWIADDDTANLYFEEWGIG